MLGIKVLLLLVIFIPFLGWSFITVPVKHRPISNEHSLCHFVLQKRNGSTIGRSLQQNRIGKTSLQTSHEIFTMDMKVAGLDYKLTIDTGSSDLIIKGEQTTGVPQVKYQSPGGYENLPKYQLKFLDGSLLLYSDSVKIQFSNLAYSVPLLVAYDSHSNFDNNEGLVGLADPSLARHHPTFLQILLNEGIISKYIYGLNLNLIQHERSSITLGGSDRSLYLGNLTYFNILSTKFVAVRVNWMRVGGGSIMLLSYGLVDIGNTCITVHKKFEQEIVKSFNGGSHNKCGFQQQKDHPQYWLLLCEVYNFQQLPTITINLSYTSYQIPKQYYLRSCTKDPANPTQISYYCDTYIESVEGYSNIFLGAAFFNRFYIVIDLEERQLGIAPNRQNITINSILAINRQYDPDEWNALLHN